jgi:UDP-glucose 4-epimerase
MDVFGAYTEVLIRWMGRIVAGLPPLILGDGRHLAAKGDASDEVFNIASGTETSLNDLAAALLKVMGSDLRPEYGPERKVNPVSRRLADTRRAASKLGFQAQVSLEEGLARLVGWWRSEHLAQGQTRASSA